jgi:hypothetical protein
LSTSGFNFCKVYESKARELLKPIELSSRARRWLIITVMSYTTVSFVVSATGAAFDASLRPPSLAFPGALLLDFLIVKSGVSSPSSGLTA